MLLDTDEKRAAWYAEQLPIYDRDIAIREARVANFRFMISYLNRQLEDEADLLRAIREMKAEALAFQSKGPRHAA